MNLPGIYLMLIAMIRRISFCETFHESRPEQVHLSFGNDPREMVVTWTTFVRTDTSVWYESLSEGTCMAAKGFSTKFVDGGKRKTVRYIHRVSLQNLVPLEYYRYRCGSSRGLSGAFVFKMRPLGTDWSPRLIVYGDMGWKGAEILPYVFDEATGYAVDAIFHVGDISYNLDSHDGKVGDEFLRMIEPVASVVPYMTTVGNHEKAYNFSHYKNRFSMPGCSEGLYYSFDLGPAHIVAVSTEVYYFYADYGVEPLLNQYHWLQKDLQEASNEENRILRPWIIIMNHRPMYCSSDFSEDCSLEYSVLRGCFINCGSINYGLEGLFHENKVDLILSGHMHYYERSFPLYDNEVYNGSLENPYRNPGAAVHVITGAAGMKCGTESASYVREDRFPFFSSDHSFTVLTIFNRTHLNLNQISASKHGETIDSVWIIKDSP